MPGLVPGIHDLVRIAAGKTWVAGTSPAMTDKAGDPHGMVFKHLPMRPLQADMDR